MKSIKIFPIVAIVLSVFLSACATNGPSDMGGSPHSAYGVVKAINISYAKNSGINAGTVIGGIAGAVAGNQVGGGNGNTLATVAGAVGGAAIGHSIKESNNTSQIYTIQIRLDNGDTETVTQKGSVADLRVGDRVEIVNGHAYRA